MIAKFEEDPPLSSKTSRDSKDPTDLLAFVSKLTIGESESRNYLIWLALGAR
uniref:Uncharacterized protein n=1 Tax=Anguilla anguilla TaxID=7936 RepID=A0A0E9WBV1_ANGAN